MNTTRVERTQRVPQHAEFPTAIVKMLTRVVCERDQALCSMGVFGSLPAAWLSGEMRHPSYNKQVLDARLWRTLSVVLRLDSNQFSSGGRYSCLFCLNMWQEQNIFNASQKLCFLLLHNTPLSLEKALSRATQLLSHVPTCVYADFPTHGFPQRSILGWNNAHVCNSYSAPIPT